ncbi:Cytochrome p450 [Thalictrum thalictroides]|uniref:Cytochrome p450 n=1 Tax=Thalictrum thalictroides TaxID=46969 RepID=A0A7J6VKM1_THATH|nr:Cytochrome p450 [Thalictrum thalictroides]
MVEQTWLLLILDYFGAKCVSFASWVSVRDEIETTIQAIASKASSPVNNGEVVFDLTNNIYSLPLYRVAFGLGSVKDQDKFIAIMHEFSKLFGALNFAD